MAALNTTIISNPYTALGSFDAVIVLLVVVFLSFRLYRGVKGQRFSNRLYLLPLIYITLTVLTLFEYPATLLEITVTILAIPLGIAAGLILGRSAKVFDKEGVVHYKRSPLILGIWLVSYATRILLPYAFPAVSYIVFIVGAILAFSSGMLMGETVHLFRMYKAHKAGKALKEEGPGS